MDAYRLTAEIDHMSRKEALAVARAILAQYGSGLIDEAVAAHRAEYPLPKPD